MKVLLLMLMFGDLNVMDFGAVGGQGATDDTAAIQLALDTARQMVRVQQPVGGSYQGGQPTVYFPAGRYHIKSQLNIPSGYACLRGEDALVSNTIPLIRSAPGYDLTAAVNSITTSAPTSLPMYSITFRANQFVSTLGVPDPLLPFVK